MKRLRIVAWRTLLSESKWARMLFGHLRGTEEESVLREVEDMRVKGCNNDVSSYDVSSYGGSDINWVGID